MFVMPSGVKVRRAYKYSQIMSLDSARDDGRCKETKMKTINQLILYGILSIIGISPNEAIAQP